MRKKLFLWQMAYYAIALLIYVAFFYSLSLILDISGVDDLGTIIAVTDGLLFFATPIIIAVIMRFSLFKWYVDPIASAEIPLFLYFAMVINQMKYTEGLYVAFLIVNKKLCDDGGMGWIFLIGLFVFGLAASFSFARKRGESISYRLLSRLCG